MCEYDEIIASLEEMRSRFDSGFLSYDRELIEALHLRLFGKVVNRACGNCYRDAYILIYSKLKKDKTMPKIPNYEVKAGVLIHTFGTSEYYTNPLPNDEVALDFLAANENNINLFARYPKDWEEQLKKYKAGKKKSSKDKAPKEEADKTPEKPVEKDSTDSIEKEAPADTKEDAPKEEIEKEDSPKEEATTPAKEKATKSKAKK